MSEEEALKWAARLDNKLIAEVTFDFALMIILQRLKQRIPITLVYPTPGDAWIMVVTSTDPTTTGEEFEMGKLEDVVGKFLTKEGIQGLQFITADGVL
ncbi:hypothetical protein D9615_004840 [Tricholomella constricta]|uniref:Uncharacterized protein n=1 Tax=Tricholomella constricta TaxID=117010 RepID=A0A8H5HH61_9AGAR|nr:hypothetical protein D9615_004840 [Tricholomella constricta]